MLLYLKENGWVTDREGEGLTQRAHDLYRK